MGTRVPAKTGVPPSTFFSYDRARRSLVLRQFHQEGFVNQYLMAPGSAAGTVVFESEALESTL